MFGLCEDFHIMGMKHIGTAHFLKYGFTPGMGDTLPVPLL